MGGVQWLVCSLGEGSVLGGMEVGARMAVGYIGATGGLEWEGVASG